MTFFLETTQFIAWLFRVIAAFMHVRPVTTVAVIAMAATSRITYLMAFFAPLKVLLLAGSPGIPDYFRFFIAPDQKMQWIYILAAGAIASYLLTIILESMTERFSMAGSEEVLEVAEAIPLFENQKVLAQNYYSGFCQICADILFVGVGFIAGFFIYFQFFAFLAAAFTFLFLVSAIIIRPRIKSMPGSLSHYIHTDTESYIKVLSSVVFLTAFVFLLIPFLVYDYTNILVALLSFLIMRRSLDAVRSAFKNAVKLAGQKHKINALVFRGTKLYEKQAPEEVAFMDFFNKDTRRNYVEKALKPAVHIKGKIDVLWEDSPISGINTFAIIFQTEAPRDMTYFREHVFSPKQSRKLESETFLFTYISREHLNAPRMITLFLAGQFQCQVLEYGTGQNVKASLWPEAHFQIMERLWSCAPPPDLVKTWCASAPLLHDRLKDDFVSALEIAADSDHEIQVIDAFRRRLPMIRQQVEKLPLHVYNPDLKRNNVVNGENDALYVMFWGRWTLEPIGAGMPASFKKMDLSGMVERIRQKRNDIPRDFSTKDILFAADCLKLESLVKKKQYKEALGIVNRLVKSACSQRPDDAQKC